jgi:hypothetical protein
MLLTPKVFAATRNSSGWGVVAVRWPGNECRALRTKIEPKGVGHQFPHPEIENRLNGLFLPSNALHIEAEPHAKDRDEQQKRAKTELQPTATAFGPSGRRNR